MKKLLIDFCYFQMLRGEILQMKSLLVECDRAKEEKLIQEVEYNNIISSSLYTSSSLCSWTFGLISKTHLTCIQ